mmetsp:Transcript_65815/g.96391  ORF Transcript_65815/g.96391 Transcript_65815/m.96391 type:complete len:147 (-) Transcript_65815:124-564(-)
MLSRIVNKLLTLRVYLVNTHARESIATHIPMTSHSIPIHTSPNAPYSTPQHKIVTAVVCVYVCVCVCVYKHTHAHKRAHARTHTHTHVHTHKQYTYTYTHNMCVFICVRVHVYVNICTHTYTRTSHYGTQTLTPTKHRIIPHTHKT